ncbi:MAG: hypothetical protein JWL83_3347 [Actinomycetia bacterium]|nr:hypothetical protein [Actinomycetes bacterium]
MVSDPIHHRRARIAHWVGIAKRVGYGALLVGIVAFFVGLATSFPAWAVTTTIVALVASFVILPLPIVLGYGVRAAEREERATRRP